MVGGAGSTPHLLQKLIFLLLLHNVILIFVRRRTFEFSIIDERAFGDVTLEEVVTGGIRSKISSANSLKNFRFWLLGVVGARPGPHQSVFAWLEWISHNIGLETRIPLVDDKGLYLL